MREQIESLLNRSIFYGLLLFVSVPAVLNFFVDADSGLLHFLITLTFFGLQLLFPRHALWILLFTAPLWAVPLFLFGLPNQFLIEFGFLGTVFGALVQRPDIISQKNITWDLRLTHPFIGIGLFVIVVTLTAKFVSLGEFSVINLTPISPWKSFAAFSRQAFLWDVQANYLHGLSISIGYGILLLSLLIGMARPSVYHLTIDRLCVALLGGSFLVFGYCLLELLGLLPVDIHFGVNGPFQNANHLSFYGALITLVAAFSIYRHRIDRGAIFLMAFLVLPPCFGMMVLGWGKTSWAALAIVAIGYGFFWVRSRIPSSKLQMQILLALVAIMGLGFWAVVSFFTDFDTVMNILLTKTRREHIAVALEMLFQNPLIGIGLGNFLAKSGTGYEIHNMFLAWMVELGGLSIIPLVGLGILATVLTFRRSFRLGVAILGLYAFLSLCHFMDIFFSYRGFLYICSFIVLALILDLSPERTKQAPRYAGVLVAVLALAFLQGLSTVHNPQSRVNFNQRYQLEESHDANFHWVKGIYSESMRDHLCARVMLKPLSPDLNTDMKVGISCEGEGFVPFSSRLAMIDWENSLDRMKSMRIWAGRWNPVCICQTDPKCLDPAIYLRSFKGDFLSGSKVDYGWDPRFISFGMDDYVRFFSNPQEETHCSQVFVF